MRTGVLLLIGIIGVNPLQAQAPKDAKPPAPRYGVEPNLENYPQGTPQETLGSVLKAIEANKINYLLAHLTDPPWVDQRVKQVHNGKFEEMVEETTNKLAHDRGTIKELRRFLTEGTWETSDATASAQLKDVKNRRVYLRKLEGRWFFESRQQPQQPAKEK